MRRRERQRPPPSAAQQAYTDAGQQADLLAIYQLLGDPALQIH